MARPSKLTDAQCAQARVLREQGISVPTLAKKFKVSESSMYKVMDGTYVARLTKKAAPELSLQREPAPAGATPSMFKGGHPMRRATDKPHVNLHPTMAQLLRKAARDEVEVDETILAAAELVIAKANYARTMSRH